MRKNYQSQLIAKKQQWIEKINAYKSFLEKGSTTVDGKHGAEEFISMAEYNIELINLKLSTFKDNSSTN